MWRACKQMLGWGLGLFLGFLIFLIVVNFVLTVAGH